MKMINVLQRLAELDAKNPQVVKESTSVQECGPMGMMDSMPGMSLDKPSTPANFSINASAANGNEVADMMSQILTLAGMKKVGADDLGAEPQGAMVTAEPVVSVGPMAAEPMPTAADSMRSVLDKLNPEPEGDDKDSELGPFQGNSGEDDVSADHGDIDNDGDHDMDDHEAEKKEKVDEFDNEPSDPNEKTSADPNRFAHQENQPGSGNTSDGKKRQSNMPTATFETLMKEYKRYIGESEEGEEEMDEAKDEEALEEGTCSTCHKDPCACSDEKVDEGTLDILKLAGLK